MNSDLISYRVLLAVPSASLRGLLRQGAGQASVPAEVAEADSAAAAVSLLAQGGIDLVLLDGGLSSDDKTRICKAAQATKEQPLVIAVGKHGEEGDADGSVRKPGTAEEAQKAIDGCVRAGLPTRALIVDDSSTMRGIVRKILSAGKFPVEVDDTDNGPKAVEEIEAGNFDIVFLDCNMPGVDALAVLAEMRRLAPHVTVVMMTSTDDHSVTDRARLAGVTEFLQKPFYPADVDAVLYRFHHIEAPARKS
jgi:DNA-binding response OmpR family regulator